VSYTKEDLEKALDNESKADKIYVKCIDIRYAHDKHRYSIKNNDGKEIGEYYGNIKDGKLNGLGWYTATDGNSWIGDWVNGSFTGLGRMYDAANELYFIGNFKNGLLQGFSCIMNKGKDRWYGDFSDGQMIALLGYDEYTAEDSARDANTMSNAYARMDAIWNDYMEFTDNLQSQTQSNTDRFKAGLEANSPLPKIYQVPTYGTKYEGRATDQQWGYVVGN
jgi:hypothetical protein